MSSSPPDSANRQWSDRARTIAALLEPFREKDPTTHDYILLRDKLRSVYKGRQVVEQTVRTLLKKLREEGLDGVERKQHRDLGQSTLPPLVREYVRDLLITQRISKKKIQEKTQTYAREILELVDFTISYDQILFIDKAIPEHLKTLGQDGVHAYRNRHEIAEQFEAEYANQLAHADNHLLDFEVIDPETGRTYRPWISVLLDDYSRAILGFYLSKRDPGSRGVALAFRHALLAKAEEAWVMRGIVDNVYFDHGKEYLSEHITDICLHLGSHIMTHEEYHPQAKGKLEKWFDTLEEGISGEDGYVGSDLKKRSKQSKAHYTLEETRDLIATWIIETYHERVHTTTKLSPRKRWVASAHQRAIRMVNTTNERQLDFLLHSRQPVISKLGIRLNNLHYMDPEYKLENHIGEKVVIYFDPWSPSQLFVYRVDDHSGKWMYLCTAGARSKRVFDDEERKEVAAHASNRRKPKQAEVRAARQRVQDAERRTRAAEKSEPSTSTKDNTSNPATTNKNPPQTTASIEPEQPVTLPSSSKVVRLSDLLKEYDNG